MKNKKGILPIFAGSLFLVAALLLTGYNLYDEYRAGQSVGNIVKLIEISPGGETSEQSFDEVEIPDYILNPNI